MTRLQILGPLLVGEPGQAVRGQMGRALAALLLQPDQPIEVGELARWALGDDHRDANARVHVLVARLRHLLRSQELPAEIVTTSGAYRLNATACEVDARQFIAMVTTEPWDGPGARKRLQAALAMWRGDVAEGLGMEELPAVLVLQDLRLSAAEDLFALEIEADDFRTALPGAVALCRAAPERERLVALVTVALYRSGRHAEALDLLHRVGHRLREDRGLELGRDLQALELAILHHDADAVAASIGHGSARRPLVVRSADAPVTPAGSPIVATNLPVPLSSLVGRAGEVAEVVSLHGRARVVTLTGVGGVGKTRLALEVAGRLAGRATGDGSWWCELAPLQRPFDVVGVVAKVLGVTPQGQEALIDVVVRHLQGRQATLVLDNCEHVLDLVADLVEELCRRCPRLRVLATSREPLGVVGEHTYTVLPLDHADAVALFSERALAARSSFAADGATEEICRRLDGIPLALEMAAARVRSMQPAEIAARLDERLRFLVSGRRGGGRHETMRAAVAWSHELLDEREQRVFRRLAVFAGGFDLAAVEAIAGDDHLDTIDVDVIMHSLVSKSLVVADVGPNGETRYALLETIRAFAREQLAFSHEDAHRRRLHAIHLRQFVAAAAEGLRGHDEGVWADRVAVELDNLRAAFAWSVEVADADLALGLFAPLPPTSLAETTAYEMFSWIDPALALPGAGATPQRWSALMWVLARAANLQEFASLERYVDWARVNGEPDDRPELLSLVALWNHAIAADLAEAARCHRSASVLFRSAGDEYHAVRADALELWCRTDDDVDDALEELAARARALRNPYMTAFGLGAATCAPRTVLRNPARALELLDEATTWGRRSRNPFLHRAIGGARVLALTLLGHEAAILEAKEAIASSRNLNQIGVAVGALSVAFSVAGHNDTAAELIGATSRSPTVFNALRQSTRVNEIWDGTRRALGDAHYEQAVARGRTKSYDELIDWLCDALQEMAPPRRSPTSTTCLDA